MISRIAKQFSYNIMKIQDSTSSVFGKNQELIGYLYYQMIYAIFYFVGFHTLYAICTLNYHVLIFYALVIILQRNTKRSQKYIDWLNKVIQFRKGLHSTQIILQEQIGPDDKCMFGFHPHGVLATSFMVFMNYPNSPFQGISILSSRLLLNVPFIGFLIRLWGFQSVDKHHIKKLMQQGKKVALLPGGYEEATITVEDELRVYINNRKGFIKYALENNYAIYPVLALNEHKVFWTYRSFEKARLWLNKFKIPGVLYWNKASGPFLPRDMDWIAVVGKAIRGKYYTNGQEPTPEEIDQIHEKYIQEIKRIHRKHSSLSKVPLKIY